VRKVSKVNLANTMGNLSEIRKMLEEITKQQKNGNAYKIIPEKFWEEFEDVMDGLRMKYFILGLQPDEEDVKMVKALYKKVVKSE
jgi:hypothetical protein